MTMTVDKVLYTGQAHTTGGQNGASRSSDGRLDIKLSSPGAPGNGTNPEQMFAAGWSACFMGAMGVAAAKMKTRLPADAAIDAEVDLCDAGGERFPQARLNLDRRQALIALEDLGVPAPCRKRSGAPTMPNRKSVRASNVFRAEGPDGHSRTANCPAHPHS